MASGFGLHGGPSRCFGFWQEFRKCYATADSPAECAAPKADYLECLHHTKELERAMTIRDHLVERQHQETQRAREAAKKGGTGAISLGLVDTNEQELAEKSEPAEEPAQPEQSEASKQDAPNGDGSEDSEK